MSAGMRLGTFMDGAVNYQTLIDELGDACLLISADDRKIRYSNHAACQ